MTTKRLTTSKPDSTRQSAHHVAPDQGVSNDVGIANAAVTNEELADLGVEPERSAGRHWLKYAGIGAPRASKGSQEETNPDNVTSLGSLEAEVMGILWEIGRPATGMEVMETTLYKRRAHDQEPPSFSSIATTLRRLTTKGLLETRKNETRTPLYWPKVERERMAARILNNVSQTLLGSSLHDLLPKLIGRSPSPASSPDEEENLQRLMEALEQVAETDRAAAPATNATSEQAEPRHQ